MNVISLLSDGLFLLLQVLNIFNDSIVELRTNIVLELLICLVFINIDDLSFDLLLLLSVYWLIFDLFLELILGNVDQVRYVSCWLGIFGSFSSTKTEILLFLTNFSCGCFLVFSLAFLCFMQRLLPWQSVISHISDG